MTAGRGHLPDVASLLVVCAHPDDESFGLGAIVHSFATRGTKPVVLCFTHGEASTLHGVAGDLGTVRVAELTTAGTHLGVDHVEVLDYPDGMLADQPREGLVAHVVAGARDVDADALLVFDHGGVTGHPDHQAATDAAIAAADELDLLVLAWAIPTATADALNGEFGTTFVGRHPDACDIVLDVDRSAQLAAIRCHASQSSTNTVLQRRLELQPNTECLRVLRPRSATPG